MNFFNQNTLAEQALAAGKTYGLIGLKAILLFLIGLKVIKFLHKMLDKAMVKKNVEPSLRSFINSGFDITLRAALIIAVIGMLGVQTTSLIAIFGAAGLAVGIALKDTLSNFAGGVMILLFKPFKVGDFIEAQGFAGTVKSINVFNSVLHTGDRKTIILPNGPLSSGSIVNISREPVRRVDMTFGIGYGDDLKLAKDTLRELTESDERILKDPKTDIFVSNLGASSVDFVVRAFVKAENYWPVFFDMQEKVKLTFDSKGISIPYPQQDVHVYQVKQ
ncbi:mechanosensitive ion channel family protein [Bacteriovorax sp. Seq25_V]|uniref:mechanosensitive ion channel family protein n=1 Tax=Bacteriovorax sp. Seq25_V TaxID=1201288 RepID=UPI00038A2BCE|nr:mechanosensitive ion channel domain-containing protein [Bacteriovorax sp. Seq25_V]EQC47191.1 transporter, small conductance mechanosensitive ion channel MscS family protein [Bacteriovorax sp. Seq25_V]